MYTKENWYANDGQIYPTETGKTLAIIPYYDKENKEQEANALLIASAPELLEACRGAKQLLDSLSMLTEEQESVLKNLEEAIAKAEGKG